MNETQKKEKYAQKLRDAGIEFEVVGRYLSTPEGYRNQEFRCSKGHEVWGSRARMLKGQVKCPSCPEYGHRRRDHKGYENELLEMEATRFPIEQYKGALIPILHQCQEGHIHKVSPKSVLSGADCLECQGTLRYTNETFDKKLIELKIYQHSRISDINGIHNKIKLKCHTCDNEWETLAQNILKGSGCPNCAIFGFNKSKPAHLYYVRLEKDDKTYYKIGVTNKDPAKRFNNCPGLKVKILLLEYFDRGANALFKEQKILETYKEFNVKDKDFLPQGGYTELFVKDVLNLDLDFAT